MTDTNAVTPFGQVVEMEDGSKINFGTRAKLLSKRTMRSNGFDIIFQLITGKLVNYSYTTPDEAEADNFLLDMAAFGAENKVKASTAGKTADQLLAIVEAKVEELVNRIFITRNQTGCVTQLTLLQEAYVLHNEVNISTVEALEALKSKFTSMSREEKSELSKTPDIKRAITRIKISRLQEELEAA